MHRTVISRSIHFYRQASLRRFDAPANAALTNRRVSALKGPDKAAQGKRDGELRKTTACRARRPGFSAVIAPVPTTLENNQTQNDP